MVHMSKGHTHSHSPKIHAVDLRESVCWGASGVDGGSPMGYSVELISLKWQRKQQQPATEGVTERIHNQHSHAYELRWTRITIVY